MTTVDRYRQICEQRAYQRRIAAFGLPALLAPYRVTRPVVIPEQRRRVVRTTERA